MKAARTVWSGGKAGVREGLPIAIGEEYRRLESDLKRDLDCLGQLEQASERIAESLETLKKTKEHSAVLLEELEKNKKASNALLTEYIGQRANYLADRLEEGKPCPVCGSTVHPKPAGAGVEMVNLEEVERAQKEVERSQDTFNEILRKVEGIRQTIAHHLETIEKVELSSKLKSDLSVKAKEIYIKAAYRVVDEEETDISNEELTFQSNIGYANAVRLEEKRLLAEKKEKLENAYSENEDRKKIVEKAEEELKALEKKREEFKEECERFQIRLETLEADLKVRRERLSFNTLAEAKEDLSDKRRKAKSYERALEAANKDYEAIKAQFEEIYRSGTVLHDEKERLENQIAQTTLRYKEGLKKAGFTDESLFLEYRGEIKMIPEYAKEINDYKNQVTLTRNELKRYDTKLEGKKRPDLDALQKEETSAQNLEKEAGERLREAEVELERLKILDERVKKMIPRINEKRENYDSITRLDSIVNKKGESFAQYVLSVYFTQVLERANQKLTQMTDGLYRLRQPAPGRLGVEVYDSSTNTLRDVKTLSGGETFMASLALALGFSEVVEEQNGGVRLDTIFIDEGFGSLDPDYLDKALSVLQELTGNRRVAIISHVELLKERIAQQIVVTKRHDTSSIELKLY